MDGDSSISQLGWVANPTLVRFCRSYLGGVFSNITKNEIRSFFGSNFLVFRSMLDVPGDQTEGFPRQLNEKGFFYKVESFLL